MTRSRISAARHDLFCLTDITDAGTWDEVVTASPTPSSKEQFTTNPQLKFKTRSQIGSFMSFNRVSSSETTQLDPWSSGAGPSDSTGLVSRLLRRRGGDAGARGICFGEHRGLGPRGRRFHLRGHFH